MAIWCSKWYREDVDASLVMLRLVILTISRSKSLSDQTSSNCSAIGLVAKDTETEVERNPKPFAVLSFLNSKGKYGV